MAGDWVGSGVGEKIELLCPKCSKKNMVLWIPEKMIMYRKAATTGGTAPAINKKNEKVEGTCECGYKFKPKDLDDC